MCAARHPFHDRGGLTPPRRAYDEASTLRSFGITSQAVQTEFAERFKRDPKSQAEFIALLARYVRALNTGGG